MATLDTGKAMTQSTAEADPARKALAALWALWNDPQWCRMKAGYMRGHLSYANSLDEKERGIRAVLATAPVQPEPYYLAEEWRPRLADFYSREEYEQAVCDMLARLSMRPAKETIALDHAVIRAAYDKWRGELAYKGYEHNTFGAGYLAGKAATPVQPARECARGICNWPDGPCQRPDHEP